MLTQDSTNLTFSHLNSNTGNGLNTGSAALARARYDIKNNNMFLSLSLKKDIIKIF